MIKQMCLYSLKSLFFTLIFVTLGFLDAFSQCPTVSNPNQSFCDIQSPTISNLVATPNGNGVRWFATAISTSALSPAAGLINGEDYYADDNSGTCGARQRVDVIIYSPPDGLNFQGVCVDDPMEATIADLLASGNDVRWYSVPNGGTALPPSTILNDNTIYYADQSNPITGCRSSRLSVFVNVGVVPVPTGNAIQEFCVDQLGVPTVADLVASGANNNWYNTISSASPLDPSTPLMDGENYYATTVDPPCESIERFEVLVVFKTANDPGTSGTIDICETEITTIQTVDLFDGLNGTPMVGGLWTGPFPTSNGSIGTVNITAMTVSGSPYIFTYTVNTSTDCPQSSTTVAVTILPPPNVGTNGTVTFCENASPVNLFDSLGGSPDTGGTWSPALASGTGLFDPSVDAAGTYTYILSGTPPCADATATVTVTILPPPNAGTNGSVTFCENGSAIDLFDSLGGTPDTGGTWSPALANGAGLFDPTVDAAGTYTYTITGIPPCTDVSATVTVTILPPPNAGTDGTVTFCENATPVNLFDSLGGTPDTGGAWSPTLASGTGFFDPSVDSVGTYTYTVTGTPPCADASATVTVTILPPPNAGTNGSVTFCENATPLDLFDSLGGTPDTGGTWSPALTSGTGVFDPTVDTAGTYTYTITGTPPCPDVSATVTVTILPPPNAGTNGAVTFCENATPVDLFDSLGGAPDTGGTWSPALASGTGFFDPSVDSLGTYTYTITGTSPCSDATATVTVTILPPPNAGTNGSVNFCENATAVDLFDSLGGTPDTNGTWSPALASGTGLFDPSVDSIGTYTYTVTGTPPCADVTATVTVTILPPPNAGTNGSVNFCENGAPTNLFDSLGGTPDAGGTWSPALASGTGLFDPSMDTAGTYTYTVSTPPCNDATATIIVALTPPPNAGTNGSINYCENATAVDLFDSLGGTPDTGGTWSPVLTSGTGLFDPTVDAPGTYTYTVTGTAPCTDASATVAISITPPPNAGTNGSITFCENGTPTDLFDSLGGTPDIGGTWSPALNSGTGVFDPNVDTAGTYTYTVTGTPPCINATATVTVTISPLPNAGLNGSLVICESGLPEDLFDSLGGSPDIGGTWSPALTSGTGVFDPNVDTAGTYTYTVTGTSSCTASAIVIVNTIPEPNAGTDGSVSVCNNGASINLFNSLIGTPDTGGTWSPALASGTGVFDPTLDAAGNYTYTVDATLPCRGTSSAIVTVTILQEPNVTGTVITAENVCIGIGSSVTIANADQLVDGSYTIVYDLTGANTSQNTVVIDVMDGSSNFTIPETVLTNPGTTTITIIQVTSVTTTCNADVTSIAAAQFEVYVAPKPSLITDGNTFCEEDNPTIQNLSDNIIEQLAITWYDAPTDGTAYQPNDPLIDGDTYYASLMTTEGCESSIRLAVTVIFEICREFFIPDGFSPNDDGTNDDFDIPNIRTLFPNFTLEIFNRYGNVLYKGTKDTPNWDGTSKESSAFGNSVLPVGVYFYVLEFNDGIKEPRQGRVYLSR